jgi:hypothetical protein
MLFPNAGHDDQVASLTMLLAWIKARKIKPALNIRRL